MSRYNGRPHSHNCAQGLAVLLAGPSLKPTMLLEISANAWRESHSHMPYCSIFKTVRDLATASGQFPTSVHCARRGRFNPKLGLASQIPR